MAKCMWCKRDLTRAESQKAVAEYHYADGHSEFTVPSEGLAAKPGGQLIRAYHYKHFKMWQKRQLPATDVAQAGRSIGAVPTAYQITAMTANQDELRLLGITEEEARTMSTAAITERVRAARLESLARSSGEAIRESRDADPGYDDPELGGDDWRWQTVVEVGDLGTPDVP